MTDWFFQDTNDSSSSQRSKISEALDALITASAQEEIQHVLEEHKEVLLSENTLVVLFLAIAQEHSSDDAQTSDVLYDYLNLLEDARINSISQACQRLSASTGRFEIPQPRIIQLLNQAIESIPLRTEIERDPSRPTGTIDLCRAELQSMRGSNYMNVSAEEQQIKLAIDDFNAALKVFSKDNRPGQYAQAHMKRGLAYLDRSEGARSENIEQAVADFSAALDVFTQSDTPQDWAAAHMLRGLTSIDNAKGDRTDNLAQAVVDFDDALTVFTHEASPYEWALLHMNRGYASMSNLHGERAERLERAITDYDAALSVFTLEEAPLRWAAILKNRASAYTDRVYGSRDKNLQQAVADYNAVLTVFTLERMPHEYREIQFNLAQLYIQLQQAEEAKKANEAVREATKRLIELTDTQGEKVPSIPADDRGQEFLNVESIAAAVNALLETSNWSEIQRLLQEPQSMLLSDQAVALLREQVAAAEETTHDGRSEFLHMRLDLLENARSEGIEVACQRFTSDLLKAAEVLQQLQMAHTIDEVGQTVLNRPEVYLATPVLALMYSTIKEYRASNNPVVYGLPSS